MQRCWERSRHEVRIRELCTSPMSLNTCIFLEMSAEGGSQARTGAEQRLPPHRLSNTYGFPCTVAKSDNLCASGFSMVTQPHSPSIILTLRGKGFFFFPSRSKFILKSSTFLPGSHGHGTCSCALLLPPQDAMVPTCSPSGPSPQQRRYPWRCPHWILLQSYSSWPTWGRTPSSLSRVDARQLASKALSTCPASSLITGTKNTKISAK